MQRVVGYAPGYDEVWLDTLTIGKPYIFLLAAQPLPPAQAHAQMNVQRRPPATNYVVSIERYRFHDLLNVPTDLPALEAIPDRFGRPAFVIQEWRRENQRVLIVRGASELPPDDRDSPTSDGAAEQP
jgi:hypothetical protein